MAAESGWEKEKVGKREKEEEEALSSGRSTGRKRLQSTGSLATGETSLEVSEVDGGGGSIARESVPGKLLPPVESSSMEMGGSSEHFPGGGGGGAASGSGSASMARSTIPIELQHVRAVEDDDEDSPHRDGLGSVPDETDDSQLTGEEGSLRPSKSMIAQIASTIDHFTFQERVWRLFDDPSSSRYAQILSIVIMVVIGVSVTAFVVETLPILALDPQAASVFETIELISIIIFTIEFLCRIFSCPDKAKFIREPLNIVDFMAIVPFYIEQAAGGEFATSSGVLRVVRLVRVFRVFKISRYVTWVKVFGRAMMRSAQPLAMLIFIMMIGMVVFSSAMYYVERGVYDPVRGAFIRPDGSISPFDSIPAAFWWCIITMTTVGYGDVFPVTVGGRIVAAVTSLAGVLVVAIPITVISTNFNEQYNRMRKSQQRMRARMVMLKNQFKKRRTGLDAMQDEVDELVRRNTAEFRKEVEDLFDLAAAELREELKAVVRLAFKQRRRKFMEDTQSAAVGVASTSPLQEGGGLRHP